MSVDPAVHQSLPAEGAVDIASRRQRLQAMVNCKLRRVVGALILRKVIADLQLGVTQT